MKTSFETDTQHQDKAVQETLFLDQTEPDTTTNERIVIGNNDYDLAYDVAAQVEEQNATVTLMSDEERSERSENQFYYTQKEYLAMLEKKVKNELITQLCTKGPIEGEQVNFRLIADVIEHQMRDEMKYNLEAAIYLESQISPAKERPADDFSGKYTNKDVEMLEIRRDNHLLMHEHILAGIPGDEDRFVLAEAYVTEFMAEAEKEAAKILFEQQLEARVQGLRQEVNQLRRELARKDETISELKAEIGSRDLELHEYEMEDTQVPDLIEELTRYAQQHAVSSNQKSAS